MPSTIHETDATPVACIICLQESIASPLALAGCGHEFCKGCLEQWFEKFDYETAVAPNCPKCRTDASQKDIENVLGRSLKRSDATMSTSSSQEPTLGTTEIDAFTRTYLEDAGAKQCPDCGVWIVKEEGCDNMKCRCGCCFCFACAPEICTCGMLGTYYDNVLGREDSSEEESDEEEIQLESLEEETWNSWESYTCPATGRRRWRLRTVTEPSPQINQTQCGHG
ncbi:expressed unknown protein [Seminavis robusta]|uniref:RING-type domain-containing protein n=1 Tax=Seminavis robusta TaxID=568900 RepID=A0A9N8ERD9_9STRA|nr:expressed unknown protein [Seminavis robusta]|eukprot:Sro1496_g277500.1 n/a (224) ;mRNA; r:8904-9575